MSVGRALLVLVASVGCGDSGSKPHPDAGVDAGTGVVEVTLPSELLVTGVVHDTEGAPVADATVATSVGATNSGANGQFAIVLAPGRARLGVTKAGYFPHAFTIGVGTDPQFAPRITIAPRAADVVVDSNGGIVDAGGAMLTFPVGAYAGPTKVTARWLASSARDASSGSLIFSDQGASMRMVGSVLVDAPTPSAPVTLTVDVPIGGDPAGLVLYALGPTGAWIRRGPALSTTSTTATFSVSVFSSLFRASPTLATPTELAVAEPSSDAMVLRSAVGPVYMEVNGKPPELVFVGQSIPEGAVLRTDTNASARVEGVDGSIFDISDGTQITATTAKPDSTVLSLLNGRMRAVVTKLISGDEHVQIRTPAAVFGVRGTVLTAGQNTCPDDASRALYGLEVSEGSVAMQVPSTGMSLTVNGGSGIVGCVGCPAGTPPSCVTQCAHLTVTEMPSEAPGCNITRGCDDGHSYQIICSNLSCGCLRDGASLHTFAQGATCASNLAFQRAWRDVCGFPGEPEAGCGGIGEAPCSELGCDIGGTLTVMGETCERCGVPGSPCCGYGCSGYGRQADKSAGLVCAVPSLGMTTCVACGHSGERCCGRGDVVNNDLYSCASLDLECIVDSNAGTTTCLPCGELGQVCCGAAQPSCNSGRCEGGSTVPGAYATCATCGQSGQRCCANIDGPGYSCDAGLICSTYGQSDYRCERCSQAGDPCCFGDFCDGGLNCNGGTCAVP